MKFTLPLVASGAVVLACAANVQAQYSSDVRPAGPSYVYVPYMPGPFYAGVDIGGTLLQNMRVKNNGTTLAFDPGERFDVNFGFYPVQALSVEFETGVIWNAAHKQATQPLTAMGQDVDLYQVPLLINFIAHAPLPGGPSLYFGVGGGGVVSDLYVTTGNHHRDWSGDSDVTLAYQAMAGIKVPVARHMQVDVGYKFLGTMDHTFFDGDPVLYTHTGPEYSHSILASFTFNF